MKSRVGLLLCLFFLTMSVAGQTSEGSPASVSVPPVIQFSSVATDASGTPLSGTVSMTFSLYNNAQGGEALWTETQNVSLDSSGHYSVYLGLTQANGVPATLFTTGEAHWLGVKLAGQAEQPRVFLVSVPYAMKAGDAATVGGLPPSAFVLAAPTSDSATPAAAAAASSAPNTAAPPTTEDVTTSGGTVDFLPLWDATSDITSSVVFQSGTGNTAKIGINTTTPASTLDVKGGGTIRGTLSLPTTGVATATAGTNSQPLDFAASAFNSSTSSAVNETFQWQAEPAGNDTSTPSGTLNLLFAEGTTKPAETGLHIASDGQITFATGQTFPGTGEGTITGVTAGTGLTGGGTSGTVSLGLSSNACSSGSALTALPFTCSPFATLGANTFTANQTVNGNVSATQLISNVATGTAPLQVTSTTQVPNLNASFLAGLAPSAFQPAGSYATLGANTFTGTQTIQGTSANLIVDPGGVTASGTVTGSVVNAGNYSMGGSTFAFGSSGTGNAYLGFAGNMNNTNNGTDNSVLGWTALLNNTSGSYNTAIGIQALLDNTGGDWNTASGGEALSDNTTGFYNTANGYDALQYNTTGSLNTAMGYSAGPDRSQTALTNSTAIGAYADVTQSNSLVLGSISGVNNCTAANNCANTNVGIGTTAPAYTLDVHGTGNFTGLINFASGQTFPGTGSGTITGVTAGTGLTGGGSSGSVTLALASNACAAGRALTALPFTCSPFASLGTNSFSASQTITGSVTASQTVQGATVDATTGFNLGGNLFASGSFANENASLGFAGNLTTGAGNTAAGFTALLHSTGSNNTSVGFDSLYNTTTGSYNTALGSQSGGSNNVGSANTFLGYLAGSDAKAPNLTNATAVGARADVAQSNSLVLGSVAGVNGASSNTNVGIGTTAPPALLTLVGSDGSSDGLEAGVQLTNTAAGGADWYLRVGANGTNTGAGNLSIANDSIYALSVQQNGNLNASGIITGLALQSNNYINAQTGYDLGGFVFDSGSFANGNALLGYAAGNPSVTLSGTRNTASGVQALFNESTGYNNTASGFQSLYNDPTGYENTAFGYQTLYYNIGNNIGAGDQNTAMGYQALYNNESNSALEGGEDNTAIGFEALWNNTYGEDNTAVGWEALFNNQGGNQNTCVGYLCDTPKTGISNATGIGAHAYVTQSNSLVLGSIRGVNGCNSPCDTAKVGIGTTEPSNIFTIGKGNGPAMADGWSAYSSRRWKTNIHLLAGALGKVEQLRGVSYDLKDSGKHEIGVIAEEVGEVVPEVVTYEDNGKDARGVDYSRLTALLIEAVKEQQKQITRQQKLVRSQQSQIARLSSQVGVLEAALHTAGQAEKSRSTVRLSTVKAEAAVLVAPRK